MNNARKSVLQVGNVSKVFETDGGKLNVLENVSMSIFEGESVALLGASGSGKSTLLHLCGLLDIPTSGDIVIDGDATTTLTEHQRTHIRRKKLGFIYQFHHLMAEFTALENVMMPLLMQGVPKPKAKEDASRMLEKMGLKDRINHWPGNLSGGEQQRVAIARGLIHKPRLLLADEPTGNLDPETSKRLLNILLDVIKTEQTALLMVTHDYNIAARLDRVIQIETINQAH